MQDAVNEPQRYKARCTIEMRAMDLEPGREEAIWSSFEKSGMPLELEVYEAITKTKNWSAHPSQYYVDSDEGKGREVDLLALLEHDNPARHYSITVQLIIECKKIPGNAWMFFPIDNEWGTAKSCDLLDLVGRQRPTALLKPFDLPMDEGHGCRHYHEVVLDPAYSNKKTNNIFEAAFTVTKATEFAVKKELEGLREYVNSSHAMGIISKKGIAWNKWITFITIYQPLIVFDGTLCEATLGNKRKITEVNHLPLVLSYVSSNYEVDRLPIEVCTPEYLPDYLRTVESRLDSAVSIAEDIDEEGSSWIESYVTKVEAAIPKLISKASSSD